MKEGIKRIVQSKSKRFLLYCIAFLLGIATASVLDRQVDVYFFFVTGGCLLICAVLFSQIYIRFFIILLLVGVLGALRYQSAFPSRDTHVSILNGETVTLEGYIAAEPDVRMDGVRYIVAIDQETETGEKKHGKVYVKKSLYPRYSYGDVLRLTCRLEEPEEIEDFRYDRYLARYGVFSICSEARVEKINTGKGNTVFRAVLSLKETVAKKVNTLWHEPYASFMAGLLYGYRGGLGQLNELFSRTGVTHIVAISGYNITLIATLLLSACMRLSIPRKQAFWVVVGGIVLFLIFAGLSASVVRAGIMGVLVLIARQMGRFSRIENVLVLTAVIMNIQNPFVLIWDAGFQLSFLSTVGLVYLSPHIEKWVTYIPRTAGLRESFVATLSATLMTLPLILFQFGRLSIVSLPVNMLILWAIPYIMGIGFFAVLSSYLLAPLGMILSWISWIGMRYIVYVVSLFSSFRFAAIDIHVPIVGMVLLYALIVYTLTMHKKTHYKKIDEKNKI